MEKRIEKYKEYRKKIESYNQQDPYLDPVISNLKKKIDNLDVNILKNLNLESSYREYLFSTDNEIKALHKEDFKDFFSLIQIENFQKIIYSFSKQFENYSVIKNFQSLDQDYKINQRWLSLHNNYNNIVNLNSKYESLTKTFKYIGNATLTPIEKNYNFEELNKNFSYNDIPKSKFNYKMLYLIVVSCSIVLIFVCLIVLLNETHLFW